MKLKLPQKLRLRPHGHYFVLLLCFSFLAGQVQYSYTTYYCSVEHAEVKEPVVEKAIPAGKLNNRICDECQGVEVFYHTVGVSKPSCLKVDRQKKDVVDAFVNEELVQFHPKIVFVTPPFNRAGRPILREAVMLLHHGTSPPENIPVPPINLRI